MFEGASTMGFGSGMNGMYASIDEAWATTGFDTKRMADPLCQLYSNQFKKVQDALWQSKFPEYSSYFPYEGTTGVAKKGKRAKESNDDDEARLEKYVTEGIDDVEPPRAREEPAATEEGRPPLAKWRRRHEADDSPVANARVHLLELVLFVACGLLFVLLLDLFFRMGVYAGRAASSSG
jgi:hypothetical protein